ASAMRPPGKMSSAGPAHAARGRIAVPEVVLQQDARLVPVALCRALGDTEQLSNFCKRETTEEFEVDDLRQSRLYGTERIQCLANAFQVTVRYRVGGHLRRQRGDLERSATLLRTAAADIIDEQTAHGA